MKYQIKAEMVVAIMQADTSLGKSLATPYNYGNVGNNDRGDRRVFNSIEEGLEAIYKALNNKYLSYATKVGELSNGGRANLGLPICRGNCWATSWYNWNKNVKAVLTKLTGENITENWEFRF